MRNVQNYSLEAEMVPKRNLNKGEWTIQLNDNYYHFMMTNLLLISNLRRLKLRKILTKSKVKTLLKTLKSNPVSDENESDGKASPSLAPIPISTSSSEDEDEIECKDELEKDDYGNKVNDEENDIDD